MRIGPTVRARLGGDQLVRPLHALEDLARCGVGVLVGVELGGHPVVGLAHSCLSLLGRQRVKLSDALGLQPQHAEGLLA